MTLGCWMCCEDTGGDGDFRGVGYVKDTGGDGDFRVLDVL